MFSLTFQRRSHFLTRFRDKTVKQSRESGEKVSKLFGDLGCPLKTAANPMGIIAKFPEAYE